MKITNCRLVWDDSRFFCKENLWDIHVCWSLMAQDIHENELFLFINVNLPESLLEVIYVHAGIYSSWFLWQLYSSWFL